MEQETKQQHTPEPWVIGDFGGQFFIYSTDHKKCVLYEEDCPEAEFNAHRIIACVNAMEGIEDPAAYMEYVKRIEKDWDHQGELLEKANKEIEELLKYKTACESINPDNPMAVAENLPAMIKAIETAAIMLRHHPELYQPTVDSLNAILTKIQIK